MHLRLLDYVLWLTSPVLQAGVLFVMFKRGIHRDYPFFFNYTILSVVSEPVLYVAHHYYSYGAYYTVYYLNIALSVLFSFAVLQELFKDAFKPYEALRDLSVILFRWSALVVLLVGVMWAINTASKSENGDITNAIMLAERSVRLMQCGMVFFLLLFSEYLGISRRSMLFGISLGFGFFAAINMLVVTGMTHPGILRESVLRHINSGAYTLAVITWLGYTLATAPSESTSAEPSIPRTLDWNSALEDARVQATPSSLLDDMDRTVDRLLYPREEVKVNVSASH
jgi:hypothetical protein